MNSRRLFLKGAGATLALPYLTWSSGAAAAPPAVPKRLVIFINGQGNLNNSLCDLWTPPAMPDGSLELSGRPMLNMLTPHQKKMVVVRGVDNALMGYYRPANGHVGQGHTYLSASLPRTAVDDAGNYLAYDSQPPMAYSTCCMGPSIDHFLAAKLGVDEPVHLAVNEPYGGEYHPFYKVTKDPDGLSNTQVNMVVDPTAVFNQYIASRPLPQLSRRERFAAKRTNVLDAVRDSFNALYSKVGREDRLRLQQHAQRISELQATLVPPAPQCGLLQQNNPAGYPTGDQPLWGGASLPYERALSTAQINNLVQMLTCGARDVMTLTHDNYDSPPMPWLATDTDVPEAERQNFPCASWHGFVHRSGSAANHPVLINGFRFYGKQFKYLLDQMDAVIEPNGQSLLDNSLVLWISEFGDGGAHSTDNLPVVLAGGLQGALKTNRFIDLAQTPLQKIRYTTGDLHTSILKLFGFNETFGFTGFQGLNNGGLPGLAA